MHSHTVAMYDFILTLMRAAIAREHRSLDLTSIYVVSTSRTWYKSSHQPQKHANLSTSLDYNNLLHILFIQYHCEILHSIMISRHCIHHQGQCRKGLKIMLQPITTASISLFSEVCSESQCLFSTLQPPGF